MREELRFAFLNAKMFILDLFVVAQIDMVGVPIIIDGIILLMTTTGAQSVVRDTLGIAVMPKWCAESLDYLLTVSSKICK